MTETFQDGDEKWEHNQGYVFVRGDWLPKWPSAAEALPADCSRGPVLLGLLDDQNLTPSRHRAIESVLIRIIESRHCPASLLHDAAKQNVDFKINTAIANSPNVTQETLGIVATSARHRWEWRAVSGGYDRVVGIDPALTLFFQTGRLANEVPTDRFVLSIRCFMAELMWQELAARDLVTFYYHRDIEDGDHFGPVDFGICGTAAEYCLSPGFGVDWIEKKDAVDLDAVMEAVQDEQRASLAPEFQSIGAVAIGVSCGDLEPVPESIYQSLFAECTCMSQFDAQCIRTHVTVNPVDVRSRLEQGGMSYARLPDEAKSFLAARLIETLPHPFLGGFRISHHLLATMLLHPETPTDVRTQVEKCGPLGGEHRSDERPLAWIRIGASCYRF